MNDTDTGELDLSTRLVPGGRAGRRASLLTPAKAAALRTVNKGNRSFTIRQVVNKGNRSFTIRQVHDPVPGEGERLQCGP